MLNSALIVAEYVFASRVRSSVYHEAVELFSSIFTHVGSVPTLDNVTEKPQSFVAVNTRLPSASLTV